MSSTRQARRAKEREEERARKKAEKEAQKRSDEQGYRVVKWESKGVSSNYGHLVAQGVLSCEREGFIRVFAQFTLYQILFTEKVPAKEKIVLEAGPPAQYGDEKFPLLNVALPWKPHSRTIVFVHLATTGGTVWGEVTVRLHCEVVGKSELRVGYEVYYMPSEAGQKLTEEKAREEKLAEQKAREDKLGKLVTSFVEHAQSRTQSVDRAIIEEVKQSDQEELLEARRQLAAQAETIASLLRRVEALENKDEGILSRGEGDDDISEFIGAFDPSAWSK